MLEIKKNEFWAPSKEEAFADNLNSDFTDFREFRAVSPERVTTILKDVCLNQESPNTLRNPNGLDISPCKPSTSAFPSRPSSCRSNYQSRPGTSGVTKHLFPASLSLEYQLNPNTNTTNNNNTLTAHKSNASKRANGILHQNRFLEKFKKDQVIEAKKILSTTQHRTSHLSYTTKTE